VKGYCQAQRRKPAALARWDDGGTPTSVADIRPRAGGPRASTAILRSGSACNHLDTKDLSRISCGRPESAVQAQVVIGL